MLETKKEFDHKSAKGRKHEKGVINFELSEFRILVIKRFYKNRKIPMVYLCKIPLSTASSIRALTYSHRAGAPSLTGRMRS